jgi:hypothetical protein
MAILHRLNRKREEVSLAQLAMRVDVQPRHPGSNPHECKFGFLLFIKKNLLWGSPPPLSFQKKKEEREYNATTMSGFEFVLV